MVFAEQAAPHDHYRLLRSRGIPVVLFNAAIDNLDFPCVSTDDATAAGQAYTHLASLGHHRIGLVVGPEDHMPSRRKLAAFTEFAARVSAAGQADGTASAPVEHALFSLEGGQAATTRLLAAASPASSAAAMCWPSARSGRSGERAFPCLATSRWSGMTTPPS